ncbi:RNA polymerase sigma factor [Pseudonocardia asaccharolytica]|uniref:RNA polymerase subunit sigma-24 n=1 Tax=Pseudonocardia asaccharolytica DSM 44247 = NBRC 16224 TaxID=1123024 RepID=A0A511D150_9PSEU|nr:RNA polymerase sigma factor [Pseudonocardia asaccharolytica]GEL18263.1 RNA polymerase subunit sigma-24 [Pseudonocardia asaccharolytica DSM 44247 = NBRC 16224]
MTEPAEAIAWIFREEFGRVVASLVCRFGDIDVAEDAASEALLVALEKWPVDGVPPSPGGWLTTTAANRAIDRIRREQQRDAKHQAALMIHDDTPHEPTGVVEDDRLRLIFTCCHPALAPEARVALTLRLFGGLTVAEIAAAFLVSETTMAQRITRAKAKIKGAKIPYRVPSVDDLAERLAGVLTVVYLVFNEGYLASAGDEPIRAELADEALRLGRVLRSLLPDEPEATGLLALMLLTDARRASRVADGELVPLPEQDRGGWDHALITEGHDLVRECLARARETGRPPGRYQLLAAVNAVHTDAPSWADTDWHQIAALYDQLAVVDPGPVAALNRAIASAELDGPAVGLAEMDRLELTGYHAWHATRADLLRRLGRSAEARAEYDAAIAATDNSAERAFLSRRRGQLAG